MTDKPITVTVFLDMDMPVVEKGRVITMETDRVPLVGDYLYLGIAFGAYVVKRIEHYVEPLIVPNRFKLHSTRIVCESVRGDQIPPTMRPKQ